MKREIFEVHKTVVDANGNITVDPSGYPKVEDSKLRENDIEVTRMRAYGLLGEIEKEMSLNPSREVQYGYIIRVSDGAQIEKRRFGKLADLPDPEPPEPEPDDDPAGFSLQPQQLR